MELGLKNKIAFIAASSQGLGKSVALELAQEGANIIICGRNQDNLDKTKKEIEGQTNTEVLALAGDLSIHAERQQIINAALKSYSNINILVTNSGGPPTGKIEELKPEDWDQAYQNLLSPVVNLVHGFLPGMKQQK